MIVVAVSGYRNSGKTTLVERLVAELAEKGRVATVKSIHHDVEIDTPGKDTYRHRAAGADAVVGLTPSITFTIASAGTEGDGDPDESLDRGIDALDDAYDYVVAEGFKSAAVPKILVGDIERDAVAGRILTRVTDARTADVSALADDIDALVDERPR